MYKNDDNFLIQITLYFVIKQILLAFELLFLKHISFKKIYFLFV